LPLKLLPVQLLNPASLQNQFHFIEVVTVKVEAAFYPLFGNFTGAETKKSSFVY